MIEFKKHTDFPLAVPDTRQEALELLDKYFPNITDQINVDTLFMFNSVHCVLGQTIGWANARVMFNTREQLTMFANMFNRDTEAWRESVLEYRASKEKTKAYTPTFDLKTMPWFIKTETPEQRIAAQEWLFSQGVGWMFSDFNLIQVAAQYPYLTNVNLDGVCRDYMMWGSEDKPHPSTREIKLAFTERKIEVSAVEWPSAKPTKADKIRAKIAKLQVKLANIENP